MSASDQRKNEQLIHQLKLEQINDLPKNVRNTSGQYGRTFLRGSNLAIWHSGYRAGLERAAKLLQNGIEDPPQTKENRTNGGV